MDASMTTPATEESFSPTAKPSTALLRPDVSQPPELQLLEYSCDTVKTLEEAIKGGDVSTTCQFLKFLNEQYSRTSQNLGPPEERRRIWNCAIEVLKEHSTREVKHPETRTRHLVDINVVSRLEFWPVNSWRPWLNRGSLVGETKHQK